jgi:hypothetical protein
VGVRGKRLQIHPFHHTPDPFGFLIFRPSLHQFSLLCSIIIFSVC